MAKLTGVKTIDMVNGEITKIAYDGAEYTLNEGNPQVGDLIRPHSDEWHGNPDGFYVCQSLDGDGDAEINTHESNEDSHFRRHYDVFRKITADKPAIESRVDALEERVTALEGKEDAPAKPQYKTVKRHAKVGERILITDARIPVGYKTGDVLVVTKADVMSVGDVHAEGAGTYVDYVEYEVIVEETAPAQEITHNGTTYTLVDRKAQPGDVVYVTKEAESTSAIPNDAYYDVDAGGKINSDSCGRFDVYPRLYDRTPENVLVYAPVAQPLQVGDFAKVIRANTVHNAKYAEGNIVQIVKDDGSDVPYEAHGLGTKDTRWFRKDDLAPATDVEVAEAKATAVFTKLGRKPNEFKKGDIVRGFSDREGRVMYGEIEDLRGSGVYTGVRTGDKYRALLDVELIAPVESRVDAV